MSKKINLKTLDNKKSISSDDNQLKKLITIFVSVSIVFVIFYVITLYVSDKEEVEETENETETTEIQYTDILVSSILSGSDKEYYVVVTKEEDLDLPLYKAYIETYSAKEKALNTFYVNLDSAFNKKFLSDTSELNVTNINDIKFKGATLLYVKSGKIVNTYEGKTKIIDFLKTKISK